MFSVNSLLSSAMSVLSGISCNMLSRVLVCASPEVCAMCQLCARGVQAAIQTNNFCIFAKGKEPLCKVCAGSVSDTPAKITKI